MLRSVVKQILNRKKSNAWIGVELLLVFCFVWYMVDYFFVLTYNYSLTSHRDLNNTYWVKMSDLPESHPDYKAEESDSTRRVDNFFRVFNRVRAYPGVESAGVSYGLHSIPGAPGYNGWPYRNAADTTKVLPIQRQFVCSENDYFGVFHHTTDGGRKLVSMRDFDWTDPQAVVITRLVEKQLFPGESAIGKELNTDYSPNPLRVKGVIDDLKRFAYLRPGGLIFFNQRLDASNLNDANLLIRMKEGQSPADFMQTFRRDMAGELQIGNYYLREITSIHKMEADSDMRFGMTGTIRTHIGLMLFFLLNILLCVIGTFWYRVNTRREEIGVRRAMGSSQQGIFCLLCWEGLCLLTFVTLPALVIEMQFVYAGLMDTLGQSDRSPGDYLPDHTALRFLITNAITWVLMACIILVGIWFPATVAARMSPVEALRDE